jgi:AraC family transcriptional regulator
MSAIELTGDVLPGIATMTHRRRLEPAYVVRGDATNRFYAAKWQLPPHRIKTDCRMDNILVCRRRGAAMISKTIGGRAQRSHAQPGAFTFIPSGEYAQYAVNSDSVFLELYVAPTLIEEFATQHDVRISGAALRPVLAHSDPWLAGYVQLLESEIELHRSSMPQLDALLLSQAQQMLLGHLVRSYAGVANEHLTELDSRTAGYALRPAVIKRICEFVDAHLTQEICLRDLAQLAHLSERHFIRAFRAATGMTPYRYVIERRLRVCADLLRTHRDMPVSDVALAMRFKSRPHFSSQFVALFGVTPTQYRATTD